MEYMRTNKALTEITFGTGIKSWLAGQGPRTPVSVRVNHLCGSLVTKIIGGYVEIMSLY